LKCVVMSKKRIEMLFLSVYKLKRDLIWIYISSIILLKVELGRITSVAFLSSGT
jgi:hypothetical protein